MLAHDEAADGSANSAVQFLELARKRAREDMDTEAPRLIASEAEHTRNARLAARNWELQGFTNSALLAVEVD